MLLPMPKALLVASVVFMQAHLIQCRRQCEDKALKIPLTATNTVFRIDQPSNNIEVTDFILNVTQAGGSFAKDSATGTTEITGTYRVNVTYCTTSTAGPTLQILSHGIGFTRSYWDFPGYSYVDAALARGYSTLTYDRLGSGDSRHSSRSETDLDPIQELQAPLEVALLAKLTELARTGKLGMEAAIKFSRVLHAGHSLGAITIYGATAAAAPAPALQSDGIALTGFSPNGSYVPYFQFASDFVMSPGGTYPVGFPAGYLKFGSPSALHANQFAPGGVFDGGLLEKLFADSQPTSIGTILTLGGPLAGVNGFQGPVIAVTGSRDMPFCGGNCETAKPSLPAQVGSLFPKASKFESVVIPGAGHALNLHLSRDTTFKAILDFFDSIKK